MKKSLVFCISLILSMLILSASMVWAAQEEEPVMYESSELWLKNGDDPIYGVLYLPLEEKDKYPVVIISHGFGAISDETAPVAQYFAEHGFAAYVYDFIGGSVKSRSGAADGDMTHMSVLTEAADLSAVIDQICELDFADPDNLFLIGQSQGGYVSSYVAAQRPEDIKALVLEYPAYALQDDCWERHGSIENVPETEHFMGQELGAIYSLDAMGMDIYDVIGAYNGDVLLIHGDKDPLVDISYSERAAEVYENEEFLIYEGASHGFTGEYAARANEDMLGFIEAHVD